MNLKLANLIPAVAVLVTFTATYSAIVQAADTAAGQAAFAICASCHGQQGEGNVALNAPKLAGHESWYLRRQLEAYQAGFRGTASGDTYGMQMRPMAMTVSTPEALENLLAYIDTLPATNSEPTVTGDVAAGQAAYAVCAACHGQNGEGNEPLGGPHLAGLDDWYLVQQINNYQNNLRGYDPKDKFGKQMRPMADTLTSAKAVDDVVAFINTLK